MLGFNTYLYYKRMTDDSSRYLCRKSDGLSIRQLKRLRINSNIPFCLTNALTITPSGWLTDIKDVQAPSIDISNNEILGIVVKEVNDIVSELYQVGEDMLIDKYIYRLSQAGVTYLNLYKYSSDPVYIDKLNIVTEYLAKVLGRLSDEGFKNCVNKHNILSALLMLTELISRLNGLPNNKVISRRLIDYLEVNDWIITYYCGDKLDLKYNALSDHMTISVYIYMKSVLATVSYNDLKKLSCVLSTPVSNIYKGNKHNNVYSAGITYTALTLFMQCYLVPGIALHTEYEELIFLSILDTINAEGISSPYISLALYKLVIAANNIATANGFMDECLRVVMFEYNAKRNSSSNVTKLNKRLGLNYDNGPLTLDPYYLLSNVILKGND